MFKIGKIEDLRKKLVKQTKEKVAENLSGRDSHVIRAVSALHEVDSVTNLLFEQVSEWYGIHFPELERLCNNNESYLRLIKELGSRKNFTPNKVKSIYDSHASKKIASKAETSMGAEVEEKDLQMIQGLAEKALGLKKERNKLVSYIENTMRELSPNFSEVAGTLLAARLLSQGGSLEKLSRMPSSTIQVLGAEKALFKHLKTGSNPPKHGFIFQHPLVTKVKRENRGKIARFIAGKISIAIKEDFFGNKKLSHDLIKAIEKRAKALS